MVFSGLVWKAFLAASPTLGGDCQWKVRLNDGRGYSQSFLIREADPRGGDTMTLVVGDNFYDTTAGDTR